MLQQHFKFNGVFKIIKKNKMKLILSSCIILSCFLFSFKNTGLQKAKNEITSEEKINFQNDAHKLVSQMVKKVGTYSLLLEKKDVIYTYIYETADGKTDISTEKYIFDGELSYGIYEQHERIFQQYKGTIEQSYDGSEYWFKHEGKIIDDKKALKRVTFNRPTNFYWFAMMQKLTDPGLNYEYIGEKSIGDANYDIVKVTFNTEDEKPKDIYQLYINKETQLVDQFLFTVAEFGRMEPNLMQVEYEKVDGFLIPTKRRYQNSNWDAEVTNQGWKKVTWSNIKFDNGLTKEEFKK